MAVGDRRTIRLDGDPQINLEVVELASGRFALSVADQGGDGAGAGDSAKGTAVYTSIAPTAAATLLLAANASRIQAVLRNTGTVRVYLGRTTGVNTAAPLFLEPGEEWVDSNTTAAWYGITASGTGAIAVEEVA